MKITVNKYEKMRYQNNKTSFWLGLLAVVATIAGVFLMLNSVIPNDIQVVLKITITVMIFLFGFLASEKSKIYDLNYSYTLVGIGGVVFLLNFWYPLVLLNDLRLWAEDNSHRGRIGAPVWSYLQENPQFQHNFILSGNGYFRVILAIVLFTTAAIGFIAAGIIGIKKSKGLKNHLASINEKQ